jgi:arabinoxylan arabinofuranohydrolase
MHKAVIFIFIFIGAGAFAQNPIGPEGSYMADPTARVWPDGKLYIYGSTDENRNYWCSYTHNLLISDDLLKWNKVSNIFVSRGINDSLPMSDALLYAPDAMYRNGKYYLYFCTPDTNISEGVALADQPTGPFGHVKALNVGKYKEIDPTVFIDDDGQAYYYWGQYNLKGGRLKPDMVNIDSATINSHLLNRKDHFFHEGSFVFKRKGLYYVVFADESRRDRRPTCLGYATGNSPLGPFKYRGVIIDNFGCDPESWNNHGSVVEFKGQWYVFYHRSTQGTQVMRRACVEPIYFGPDGSIKEVQMTSQGAGKPLSAFLPIKADRACQLSGYCRIRPFKAFLSGLGDIKSDDKAAFKYIDFGGGARKLKVSAYVQTGGAIWVHEGSANGKLLGIVKIPSKSAVEDKQNGLYEGDIKLTKGIKAIWLEFKGNSDGSRLFFLDRFWFK